MNVEENNCARAVRVKVSRMLGNLFDHWQLSRYERSEILGLGWKARSRIEIGTTRDAQDRVGHLLAIHRSLRQLFPHDRSLGYSWMKTSNKAFDGKTPVELVTSFGFSGLLMIRAYLERAMHR